MSSRPRTAIIRNASSGDGSAEAAATLESTFAVPGHDVEITLVRSGDDIRHAVERGGRRGGVDRYTAAQSDPTGRVGGTGASP